MLNLVVMAGIAGDVGRCGDEGHEEVGCCVYIIRWINAKV